MTTKHVLKCWAGALALLGGMAGACSDNGDRNSSADQRAVDELGRQVQAEMNVTQTQSALTISELRGVRPTLKCVEKVSSSSYKAHFGYSSSSSSNVSIAVGFYNRFFQSPSGRGQPTLFMPGSHPDAFQLSFASNSSLSWILGYSYVSAVSSSPVCPPTGTGGTTGTGGAAGKGGAGGAAGAGGRGGTAGSGTGGAPTCPSTCDDHNPCTVDMCSASTGFKCSNVAVTNGTACNDGNACTIGDSCQTGACVAGTPKTCVAQDACHVVGTCAPATGLCSNPAAANGVSCNDGNACTTIDSCQGGACVGTAPKTCSALDQCHVPGACVPATGVCSNPNAANGTTCTDGNMCTAADTCQAGVCIAGSVIPPTHCPGGAICDNCTADNCVSSTDGCDAIEDPTDRQLCENLYACFTDPANHCTVLGDPLKCWCGMNTDTCDTDNAPPTQANGPCLQAVIAAAHLTAATYDAGTIKLRLVDPDFPLGRAANLTICRGGYCAAECGVP